MFAIVEIAGKQIKVEAEKEYFVNQLKGEAGDKLSFDNVLLAGGDKETKVGTPSIKGAKVDATIIEHVKGDKVIVFKKKRRKGYRGKNGHRQPFTKIKIEKIKA